MTGDKGISVRRVSACDFDAWLPLWRGYLDHYQSDVPDEVTRSTFARILDDNENINGFLAFDAAGNALGFVIYVFHQTTFAVADRCYLEDLFTSADARRKGVGRELMEAVFRAAAEHGSDQVYWHTAETNYAGRMLYDKVGVKTNIKYTKKLSS